jgi:hypothetical protein
MTKDQIQSFINSYLSKQAEEGPAHEAAETPNAEMLEHAMGVGGEEQPHGAGPGGVDVEQILSQLSPEELQELVAQLTQGEGAPAAPAVGGDDVAGLSQNIESHLAQNPEAQVPGMEPEKAAALDFVKSAHYIEGFIKQALDYGLAVDQAVNMYDSALTTTVDTMKKEAGIRESFTGAKDYIKNKATSAGKYVSDKAKGVRDAAGSRLENLKAKGRDVADKAKSRYEDAALSAASRPGRTAAGLAGLTAAGAGAGYLAGKSSDEEKKAAYFDGIFKQALAYGFSEEEAYAVVKEAGAKEMFGKAKNYVKGKSDKLKSYFGKSKGEQAKSYVAGKATAAKDYVAGKATSAKNYVADKARTAKKNLASTAAGAQEHVMANKGKYTAGAGAAAGAAAGYAAGKSSDKEKKAAYLEGVFKQAMAYGFSEAEAVQFAQQAEASL